MLFAFKKQQFGSKKSAKYCHFEHFDPIFEGGYTELWTDETFFCS